MKVLVVAVAILVGLPFGLCSDDSPENDDAQGIAIGSVKVVLGHDPIEPTPVGENYPCTYAFDDATGLEPIVLTCRWDIEGQGDSFVVRLHEVWACNDFEADYAGYPACDGETGVHDWEYLWSPSGDVQLLEESGQYPPDYIRKQ